MKSFHRPEVEAVVSLGYCCCNNDEINRWKAKFQKIYNNKTITTSHINNNNTIQLHNYLSLGLVKSFHRPEVEAVVSLGCCCCNNDEINRWKAKFQNIYNNKTITTSQINNNNTIQLHNYLS